MNAVAVVGIVAGAALIAVACLVFAQKKEFPLGGVGVTLVGVVLIGMSQWTTIRIKGAGLDIDLRTLQAQITETAAAVDAVAEATVSTAAQVETTQTQLLEVTEQLERRQLLVPSTLSDIRGRMEAAPQADTTRVNAVRENIRLRLPVTPGRLQP